MLKRYYILNKILNTKFPLVGNSPRWRATDPREYHHQLGIALLQVVKLAKIGYVGVRQERHPVK